MKLIIIFFLIFQTDTLPKREKPYEIGEEVITGEKKMIINEMKILKIPPIDPFSLIGEKFSQKDIELNNEVFNYLDSNFLPLFLLNFPYLRIPIKKELLKENLIIFLPDIQKGAKNWSLNIYSQDGKIVKKIAQDGEPPKAIYWDLKTDDNNYLNVGELYYGIFLVSDFLGNETKILIPHFSFDGIIYNERDKKVILINTQKIFTQEQEEGKTIIEEIANLIKKEMPKEVIINLYRKDERNLLTEIKILEEEIRRRVPLDKEKLKSFPHFQRNIFEKIDKIEILLLKF